MAVGMHFAGAEKLLNFFIGMIYVRRKACVWFLVIATSFMLWQTAHVARDAGFDKSIPLEHEYMKVLKQYQAEFGGANTVLFALILKDGVKGDIYNEKFLTELKAATDEVFFLAGIDRSRVSSLFTPDVRYIEVVEGGFKGGNVIPAEYAPTQEMFALVQGNVGKAGIIGRLVTKDQRGAMIFSELLEVDPVTGEKLSYEKAANDIEDKVRGRFTHEKKYLYKLKEAKAPFAKGEVVAEGFRDLGWLKQMMTTFQAVKTNEDGQSTRVDVRGWEVEREEVANPQYNPDIGIHIVGFAKVVGDVIDATLQVVLFFGIAILMTMILLWMYLGDFKLAQLPLWCSVVAVIWEFGLLKTLGYGIDPFAILVPFLILAVSTSHGVQYVNAWADEVDLGKDPYNASLETFKRLFIAGTIAILTGVVGFATIYFVPIDIIREMSINASLGMAGIIITNKMMMPIWLSYLSVKDIEKFRENRRTRQNALDKLWNLLTLVTEPKIALFLIATSGIVLGWSIWKQEDRIIGDTQKGVPELRPDSRYNQDSNLIAANFAIGVDILKIIAETEGEACIKHEVMDQIDRFTWRMDNTTGVQSTLALTTFAKTVNAAFSEANPKFKVLPRNQFVMVQAITPIPTSSGLLSPNCSAMAALVFTADHKAPTIKHIVQETEKFDDENAAQFFEDHKDVDAKYCDEKTAKRRAVGVANYRLQRETERLKAKGKTDADIAKDGTIIEMTKDQATATEAWQKMDKVCPVNFAVASANVGVMAATNEVVHEKEFTTIVYVYVIVILLVYLSFRSITGLLTIIVPLAMVSVLANALMAVFGIGLKVATLPVVALAVGIGVDYGIYIYATLDDEVNRGQALRKAYFETLKKTGKAVIFTGFSLSASVITWLWSELQFQVDMGKLLVFMFMANMLGAVILLPAFCRFMMKLPYENAPATAGAAPVAAPAPKRKEPKA